MSAAATTSSPRPTTTPMPPDAASVPGTAVHTVTSYPGPPPDSTASSSTEGMDRSKGLTGGTARTATRCMAGSLGIVAIGPLTLPRERQAE